MCFMVHVGRCIHLSASSMYVCVFIRDRERGKELCVLLKGSKHANREQSCQARPLPLSLRSCILQLYLHFNTFCHTHKEQKPDQNENRKHFNRL